MISTGRLVALILLSTFCLTVFAQRGFQINRRGRCEDTHPNCQRWSLDGECYHNRGYMMVYCPKSCDQCNVHDPRCRDLDLQCAAWSDKGECSRNRKFMEKTCAKSCSVCLPAGDHSVPHIHTNLVQEFWKGNEVRLNLLRQ